MFRKSLSYTLFPPLFFMLLIDVILLQVFESESVMKDCFIFTITQEEAEDAMEKLCNFLPSGISTEVFVDYIFGGFLHVYMYVGFST